MCGFLGGCVWLCLCLSECVCLWLSMCVCMCGGLDKFHVKGSRSLPRVASKLYVIKDPYPSNIFRKYKMDITPKICMAAPKI